MSIAQDILHFYKNTEGLEGVDLQAAIIYEGRYTAAELDVDQEATTFCYADNSCIVMTDEYISAYASKD
jgi:hypothetical protein